MTRKTAHSSLRAAACTIVVVLLGAATPQVASAGGDPAGGLGRSSGPSVVQQAPGGSVPGVQSTTDADGFGWLDGALWAAVPLGLLALGLWGDALVGAVVVGIAAVVTRARAPLPRPATRTSGRPSSAGAPEAGDRATHARLAARRPGSPRTLPSGGD